MEDMWAEEDEGLEFNLYRNTMTGNWDNIVEMYKQHTFAAISARINSSRDTALHVAVSIAPENIVIELIRVISHISELVLLIKNDEGNTPLHVAASTGRLKICILLATLVSGFSGIRDLEDKDLFRNKVGETPLFLTAFHGYKPIFLYLHKALLEATDTDLKSVDPGYRRNDGETALHCAIKWEYFDVAYEILLKEPSLAYAVNEVGITPLHLLASKPSVFKSGSHLGWWKSIIYHCIYVEELEHETVDKRLIDSAIKELDESSIDDITHKFPKNYHICIQFYQVLQTLAPFVIGGTNIRHCKCRNADVESPNQPRVICQSKQGDANEENPSETDTTGQSTEEEFKAGREVHRFVRRHYEDCYNIFRLLYTIFIRIILGFGYEGIRSIKRKHVYSVQIMKILIKHTYNDANKFGLTSGANPGKTHGIPEVPLSPTDSDNTTARGAKTEPQDGNKINETAQEEKTKERGKGETTKMTKADTPLLILLPGKGETPETKMIETPILVAARNGLTEMVEQILQKFPPMAIDDKRKEMSKMTKTESTILLAARNGITEMVEHILKKFPVAINEQSEGKNIVLLAAKNRQTHVLLLLLEQDFVKRKLIHEGDKNDNNALHLAAEIGKQKPWLIPGAALQMQWEIKWYEFVKDNMPQHFCYQVNKEGKTPEEIFSETHEDLVKQGGEWLNKTSESCSVVAALIATVAFASSTTIPGNINEENGKPNLESHSMLTIFAVSSLIALCFSITALFSFLAILTSRYEQKDFRRDLPKKLLLGLTSLLVSITSMLVSFCAGHYFMLKNKLKDKAFPVYAATCLPIVFFAIQQLPLYVDIVWASFKNVPRSSYKAISL
ncbi:uncharacterized protein LOC126708593 isoform X1 [Quercus robur]|uniref:uncharacterized protein LOC126708593 isoform X1 n=1 Tax=Quercus robur TaxID=38942 RepID=UPI002161678A|nr:uncharacterized protein LOC126708593 isoform X1 [Quercus robur]